MSINEADRDHLTNLINNFFKFFSTEIKRNKADIILKTFEDIEECIDTNNPSDVNVKLPKHLQDAKEIIHASPTMTCTLFKTEFNINNEALGLISEIESCTPPTKHYPQPKTIAVSSRNESSESLVSMTTHSGDDYAYVTPILAAYKQTSQTAFVLEEKEEACTLFSGVSSCIIS